jgi:membrane protease YdiL (CAAX protease family)
MANDDDSRTIVSRAENYWHESRRPIVSLVFIVPLLIIYEIGLLLWGVQNGADAWMRQFLDFLGFSQHLLLPLLMICILLGWHYLTHQSWRFQASVFWPMIVECIFLAVFLRVFLAFQSTVMLALGGGQGLGMAAKLKLSAGYLGAGIYEELLFRLILLAGLQYFIGLRHLRPRTTLVLAVLASSLIFSVAHYLGHAGEAFQLFSFVFRFVAGVYFSMVFLYRGFGIAAGSHAAYDILGALF